MSRLSHDGPAAAARASLPESEQAAFDRLAGAVLASPGAPLGALLRAQLPGTAGVRWLRQEKLPPTTRPAALHRGALAVALRVLDARPTGHPDPRGPAGGGRRPAVDPRPRAGRAAAIPRWGQ